MGESTGVHANKESNHRSGDTKLGKERSVYRNKAQKWDSQETGKHNTANNARMGHHGRNKIHRSHGNTRPVGGRTRHRESDATDQLNTTSATYRQIGYRTGKNTRCKKHDKNSKK